MKCVVCGANKSSSGLYCKKCGYLHRKRPSGLKYELKVINRGWFLKGQVAWNKGLKRVCKANSGSFKKCCKCGSETNVYWANKSHKYKRNINDWIELCLVCHMKYDGITKLTKKQIKEIRSRLDLKEKQEVLAKEYKVDQFTISNIYRRKIAYYG